MSNEKNPGCLGYIGDYTTELCGDSNKPWKVRPGFLNVAHIDATFVGSSLPHQSEGAQDRSKGEAPAVFFCKAPSG